jgi:hypothetical protein
MCATGMDSVITISFTFLHEIVVPALRPLFDLLPSFTYIINRY